MSVTHCNVARPSPEELDVLLAGCSRTFALAIPFLPEPLRREVTVAYLLFRVADTMEDATRWSRQRRLAALDGFHAILRDPHPARAARRAAEHWLADPPCEEPGYLRLLASVPSVLAELEALPGEARSAVVNHLAVTVQGMRSFVSRGNARGDLRLEDLDDLRHYCYVVAGVVGELLTDLFLRRGRNLRRAARLLRGSARHFGEGLQLVNILKDAGVDALHGRVYLPAGVPPSRLFTIARADLDVAARYVLALQAGGAPRGLVAFTALPVLLARATLDQVEVIGAGAKVSRAGVQALVAELNAALDAGRPVFARAKSGFTS